MKEGGWTCDDHPPALYSPLYLAANYSTHPSHSLPPTQNHPSSSSHLMPSILQRENHPHARLQSLFSRGYSDFTSPSSCVNPHCIDLFVQLHDEMKGMGCGRSQKRAVQDRYPTLAIQTQSKPRDDTTPPRCTRPFQAFRYPQLAPQVKL